MSFSHILFETNEDGIALVTINRPEKRNALNREVISDLETAVSRVADDPSVKGMILTGAGEKAFVAGADIGEIEAAAPVEAEAVSARGQRIFRDLERLRKPTVAAIQGYALGGGLELAMCCHIRVRRTRCEVRPARSEVRIDSGLRRHAAFASADRPRPCSRHVDDGGHDRRGRSSSLRAGQLRRAECRVVALLPAMGE